MPEQDFFPVSPDSAARRLKAIRGCTNVATPSYRRFGKDFFDNLSIGYGYGGYAYDGRHRGPAERMADHYGLIAGQRVLDVGCAKGFLMVEFAGLGLRVAGLDVSRYAAQTAHIDVRNRIVTGDMNQELPWNDRSFDLVICKEVLPYLPPSKQAWALRELTRVAKKPEAVFVEIQCWASFRIFPLRNRRPTRCSINSLGFGKASSTRSACCWPMRPSCTATKRAGASTAFGLS